MISIWTLKSKICISKVQISFHYIYINKKVHLCTVCTAAKYHILPNSRIISAFNRLHIFLITVFRYFSRSIIFNRIFVASLYFLHPWIVYKVGMAIISRQHHWSLCWMVKLSSPINSPTRAASWWGFILTRDSNYPFSFIPLTK